MRGSHGPDGAVRGLQSKIGLTVGDRWFHGLLGRSLILLCTPAHQHIIVFFKIQHYFSVFSNFISRIIQISLLHVEGFLHRLPVHTAGTCVFDDKAREEAKTSEPVFLR